MSSQVTKKNGLKKGAWTLEEDEKLTAYIKRYGIWNWSRMPEFAGLARSGKSCRLRWMNYLKPNIKKGKFTKEEEEIIVHFHSILGNRWSRIASRLPGRTDNDVKNYWYSYLKKRRPDQNANPSPSHEEAQEIISISDECQVSIEILEDDGVSGDSLQSCAESSHEPDIAINDYNIPMTSAIGFNETSTMMIGDGLDRFWEDVLLCGNVDPDEIHLDNIVNVESPDSRFPQDFSRQHTTTSPQGPSDQEYWFNQNEGHQDCVTIVDSLGFPLQLTQEPGTSPQGPTDDEYFFSNGCNITNGDSSGFPVRFHQDVFREPSSSPQEDLSDDEYWFNILLQTEMNEAMEGPHLYF